MGLDYRLLIWFGQLVCKIIMEMHWVVESYSLKFECIELELNSYGKFIYGNGLNLHWKEWFNGILIQCVLNWIGKCLY